MSLSKLFCQGIAILALALLIQSCGGNTESGASDSAAPADVPNPPEQESAVPETTGMDGVLADSEPATKNGQASSTDGVNDEDVEEIDPESLQLSGEVELKQYTVAWGGSGTMGGGTLTIDGETHQFDIVGLGLGGIGASALEAKGAVYNLPSLEAFPGTYGNARLGLTAGESGSGKLWLRNPDGVVIELESEMRGLALAGGVDGLLIQWDDSDESSVDRAMEKTEDVVGDGIEAGADAVEDGIDKVKGWIKRD